MRGKQPKLSDRQQQGLWRIHATGEHSISDLAERSSVSRPTAYRTLHWRRPPWRTILPPTGIDPYQLETMELVKGLGLTTLAALHDLNIAATYCEFIHVIDNGRIVASGPPQDVSLPGLIEDVLGVGAMVGSDPLTGRTSLNFYLNGPTPKESAAWYHS